MNCRIKKGQHRSSLLYSQFTVQQTLKNVLITVLHINNHFNNEQYCFPRA